MKSSYDSKYDLLYIKLGNARKVHNKPVSEDIILDFSGSGKLVGIEILDASEHIDLASVLPVKIQKSSSQK